MPMHKVGEISVSGFLLSIKHAFLLYNQIPPDRPGPVTNEAYREVVLRHIYKSISIWFLSNPYKSFKSWITT